MKVIVAGMPKTGTKSMTEALRLLGYQVYDFTEHLYCLEREWDEVFRRGFTTEKFRQMYKDVDAAVDMPASYFWQEIHRAFPEAKIILTVRDSEDKWMESLRNHYRIFDAHVLARIVQFIEIILQRRTGMMLTLSYKLMLNIDRALWGKRTHLNESILKMKYKTHNAHVVQNAPAEKLLVFNCKQGWKPLCEFLEHPIPECLFPHENVRATCIDDTANKHPIGHKYKRELIAASFKLFTKLIFMCITLFVFVSMFT